MKVFVSALMFLSTTLLAAPTGASGIRRGLSKAEEAAEAFKKDVASTMALHHGGEWRNKGHSEKPEDEGHRKLDSYPIKYYTTYAQEAGCDCAKEALLELHETKNSMMTQFFLGQYYLYSDENFVPHTVAPDQAVDVDFKGGTVGDYAAHYLEYVLSAILYCANHYLTQMPCGGCVDNTIADMNGHHHGSVRHLDGEMDMDSLEGNEGEGIVVGDGGGPPPQLAIKTYDCCCDVQTVKDIIKDQMIACLGLHPLYFQKHYQYEILKKSLITSSASAIDAIIGDGIFGGGYPTPYNIDVCPDLSESD